MRLVTYQPPDFELLRRAAVLVENPCLQHREFVNYYYASSPFCRLYLGIAADGQVAGTLGLEIMRFEHDGRYRTSGFGSNFHAMQRGVGGFLFREWLHSCDLGLVFGGSDQAHKLILSQNWTYYSGVRYWYLNRPFIANPGEPAWRILAKKAAGWATRRDITSYARKLPACASDVSIQEEREYSASLLPARSPFSFRFAPALEHLSWRYATGLPFVRYRLFRIIHRHRTEGYVVMNDQERQIIVAHCDGTDAEVLACGVLRAILTLGAEADPARTVVLTSSHPQMDRIYHQFGFRHDGSRPFALGALRKRAPDVAPQTSNWLINFDLGDNGLRAPFLDEKPQSAVSVAVAS